MNDTMKLIDKSALVAEIERLRKNNEPKEYKDYAQFELDVSCGYNMALDDVEKFLNTLEVKEVDLKKEIKEQSDKYYSQCDKKLQEMDDNDKDLSFLSLDNFAKHFFELGLKAQKGE